MSGANNPSVELVGDADCPNLALARERLRAAYAELGLPAAWRETLRAPGAPGATHWGSPTVLVNGADVAPAAEASASSCRLYSLPGGGFDRAPGTAAIVAAIGRALRGG